MPRLHTLYLPGNGEGMPFAFILDQANPLMIEAAIAAWESFAEKCGARAIMFTAETIDIDPEPADEANKPIDYYTTDHSGCDHPPVSDILDLVRAAHAAAWVPWEPANLDPESPKIATHPADSCAAVNNEATGCPMHAPILGGSWEAWPFFAANPADIGPTIVRICEHGISHPTPEEYLGGFDTPHLCDGCECAGQDVRDQFSIVVSDLANTKLPRGTLLLGTKDAAAPSLSPEWAERLSKVNRDATGMWVPGAPPSPLATSEAQAGDWGTARIQPLGADGEPVGEAKDYPLAGSARVKKIPTEQGEPVEKRTTAEVSFADCGAGTLGAPCVLAKGHEGLHEFGGPFTRV